MFVFEGREYDFSKEFSKTNRCLTQKEMNSVVDFQNFFKSLKDKTPLKDLILDLASHYS